MLRNKRIKGKAFTASWPVKEKPQPVIMECSKIWGDHRHVEKVIKYGREYEISTILHDKWHKRHAFYSQAV